MRSRLFTLTVILALAGLISCGAKTETKKDTPKDTTTVSNDTNKTKVENAENNNNQNVVVDVTDDGLNIDPNASPENAVKTIIKAGKTSKYGMLTKLCNEAIDMDGDAKDICGIASAKPDHQKEFNDYFGNAKIVGKARIDKGIAEVDIETTAEGGSKETIVLQVKYDKWYLKGL